MKDFKLVLLVQRSVSQIKACCCCLRQMKSRNLCKEKSFTDYLRKMMTIYGKQTKICMLMKRQMNSKIVCGGNRDWMFKS